MSHYLVKKIEVSRINGIRVLNLWGYILFVSVTFSLVMTPTCMAKPLELESKYNDTEYYMQLQDMIKEINKLYDDVEQGKITQETANETAASLIDDPRYNQVKLKKQIVEREYELLHRNRSPRIPDEIIHGTNSYSKCTLSPVNFLKYRLYVPIKLYDRK